MLGTDRNLQRGGWRSDAEVCIHFHGGCSDGHRDSMGRRVQRSMLSLSRLARVRLKLASEATASEMGDFDLFGPDQNCYYFDDDERVSESDE